MVEDGLHLAVVERVEDLVPAIVRVLHDPTAARAMVEHSRRLVVERYDWEILADRLDQVWRETAESPIPAQMLETRRISQVMP
jgi:glycosyltransferase involved in cell wall biosynthesis